MAGQSPVLLPSAPCFPEWGRISHPGALSFVQPRQPAREVAGVLNAVGQARGVKCVPEFPVNLPAFFARSGFHALW